MVEQWPEEPRVDSSILSFGTTLNIRTSKSIALDDLISSQILNVHAKKVIPPTTALLQILIIQDIIYIVLDPKDLKTVPILCSIDYLFFLCIWRRSREIYIV